ncbi:acyl-CoA dehydrogenase family protein, partial [Xanthomonas campestris]|uniref:acyl-CoA dehydrogenase family protein n=1 Tax=Xanthomonas campestris TaxID=339 RepID=UPI004039E150
MNAAIQLPTDPVDLNDEQQASRAAARDFADKELAPHGARWDAESHFPRGAIGKAAELGFCGLYTDEGVGGLGMRRLGAAIVFEALATVEPSTSAFITIHNMATWLVARHGNDGVRAQWGAAMASGATLGSYCPAGPGSGSGAASLEARAQRDRGGYVPDG